MENNIADLYKYFVEGECEKKFIDIYKNPENKKLLAGKVEVFNFINNEISNGRIMQIKRNTKIILVYDTDVNKTDILDKNIKKLKSFGFKNIYHIQSIKNFEDEIVYATNITNITKFFDKCANKDEFKSMFLSANNGGLFTKFKSYNLDFSKIWFRQDGANFNKYNTSNGISLIKS